MCVGLRVALVNKQQLFVYCFHSTFSVVNRCSGRVGTGGVQLLISVAVSCRDDVATTWRLSTLCLVWVVVVVSL